ncbi:MAG: L,D-transpeptidase [Chitinophagaceae bacterium]|nr:L,D-transpeptidase [Chitinophagaceae bacterium]
MSFRSLFTYSILIVLFFTVLPACKNGNGGSPKELQSFEYHSFKDSINRLSTDTAGEDENLFDGQEFIPGTDSLDSLLLSMDTIWHHDLALIQKLDTFIKDLKKLLPYSPEEIAAIRENTRAIDSFLANRNNPDIPAPCRQKDCLLFAEVNKTKQALYLYIGGELKDSFPVSTGMRKYETPDISQRPRGPLLMKYKSRKFPGGNYMGLGNMPYAVFIRGGYAIHGTTRGNFAKLGRQASHGCIRLHPNNARVFFELVKRIGIANTWVTIRR